MDILLKTYLYKILFVLIAGIYVWLAKWVADLYMWRRFRFNPDRLIMKQRNLGMGIRRAGFYLALLIGMSGSLSTPAKEFVDDLILFSLDGILILFLTIFAWALSDKILLHRFNNTQEIQKGNVAVAHVEFGILIATGMVARAAFTGLGSIVSGLVFFLLGQAVLILLVRVYEWVTPYDDMQELEKRNQAKGLMICGFLISMGIILNASITGDFKDWTTDLLSFGFETITGIFSLFILNRLIDLFFLPTQNFKAIVKDNKNIPAVIVAISIKIGFALIIAEVII